MFIPNVPKVYIADPAEMEPGMQLWSVGQGGVSTPSRPYYKGTLFLLDHIDRHDRFEPNAGFFVFDYPDGLRSYSSYRDSHILPQEYNNWYLCSSKEAAEEVYGFIKHAWDTNPEYEKARKAYDEETRKWDRW